MKRSKDKEPASDCDDSSLDHLDESFFSAMMEGLAAMAPPPPPMPDDRGESATASTASSAHHLSSANEDDCKLYLKALTTLQQDLITELSKMIPEIIDRTKIFPSVDTMTPQEHLDYLPELLHQIKEKLKDACKLSEDRPLPDQVNFPIYEDHHRSWIQALKKFFSAEYHDPSWIQALKKQTSPAEWGRLMASFKSLTPSEVMGTLHAHDEYYREREREREKKEEREEIQCDDQTEKRPLGMFQWYESAMYQHENTENAIKKEIDRQMESLLETIEQETEAEWQRQVETEPDKTTILADIAIILRGKDMGLVGNFNLESATEEDKQRAYEQVEEQTKRKIKEEITFRRRQALRTTITEQLAKIPRFPARKKYRQLLFNIISCLQDIERHQTILMDFLGPFTSKDKIGLLEQAERNALSQLFDMTIKLTNDLKNLYLLMHNRFTTNTFLIALLNEPVEQGSIKKNLDDETIEYTPPLAPSQQNLSLFSTATDNESRISASIEKLTKAGEALKYYKTCFSNHANTVPLPEHSRCTIQ